MALTSSAGVIAGGLTEAKQLLDTSIAQNGSLARIFFGCGIFFISIVWGAFFTRRYLNWQKYL